MNLKLWKRGPREPRYLFAALAVTVCLGGGGVLAADPGLRDHTGGAFDATAGTYEAVKGGDPAAIASGGEGAAAGAVQVTGVIGTPSATTTISGEQLPPPPPKFGGKIERNALQSTPWWPPREVRPKGAPNVLLITTDDQGFAVPAPSPA